MANKTQRRDDLSVIGYINAIESDSRRDDCVTLVELMKRVTGKAPHMYGTAIVGFDTYHYRYDSGREGDAPVVGFASRKGDISVYLMGGYEDAEAQSLLAQLGKHKTGKGCLYIAHLEDVKLDVLEKLVVRGRDYVKKTYPA